MFFSRNDTASCRSPVRRWVCFTVEPAEILLVSQSETSSDFAEFPESPSRVLGCGKWFLLRMSPLFSPLPPPGLWNMVRAQQILCNSFLGICQIPLPQRLGWCFTLCRTIPMFLLGSELLCCPGTHQNLVEVDFCWMGFGVKNWRQREARHKNQL